MQDEPAQRAGMMPDQVQYYFQLAQQTQNQLASGTGAAPQTQLIQIQSKYNAREHPGRTAHEHIRHRSCSTDSTYTDTE